MRINFDDGATAGLHIRRAIAEFVPNPDAYSQAPDITLEMSAETWVQLYLSTATPQALIDSGDIRVDGNADEAARLVKPLLRYSSPVQIIRYFESGVVIIVTGGFRGLRFVLRDDAFRIPRADLVSHRT